MIINEYFLNPFKQEEATGFISNLEKTRHSLSKKVNFLANEPILQIGLLLGFSALAYPNIDFLIDKIGKFNTGFLLGAIIIRPLTLAIVALADKANLLPSCEYPQTNLITTAFALIRGTLAGIAEEVVFRKHIQSEFLSEFSKTARISITSFLFSMAHLQNIILNSKEAVIRQVFFSFFAGIELGILQEKAGNTSAIGAHVAFNIMSGILQAYGKVSYF